MKPKLKIFQLKGAVNIHMQPNEFILVEQLLNTSIPDRDAALNHIKELSKQGGQYVMLEVYDSLS